MRQAELHILYPLLKIRSCLIQDWAGQRKKNTVNGEHDRTMINDFLLPKIDEKGLVNICFQQVGTTA